MKTNVEKYNGLWWSIIRKPTLRIEVFDTWREAYDHAHTNTPIPAKVK